MDELKRDCSNCVFQREMICKQFPNSCIMEIGFLKAREEEK